EALPHPTDARKKGLTREQVQRLAAVHRRTLADEVQAEISASTPPSRPVSPPVLPDGSTLISELLTQLVSLQAHVVTLQHQLTDLCDQLQKEQERRTSQAQIGEEKSQRSSKEKSLYSSQEKSQRS